jgi:hypothetical protein
MKREHDSLTTETREAALKPVPTTVKLTIKDRLHVLQILPPVGSYEELCKVKGIVDKCRFTKEENETYKITEVPGGIKVDQSFDDVVFDILFTAKETLVIRRELEELNRAKNLNIGNLSLFDKFGCKDISDDKLIEKLDEIATPKDEDTGKAEEVGKND